MNTRWIALIVALCAVLSLTACKKEGKAEHAGRKLDEAVEKLRHGDEGALEKAGRKIDETADDLREKAADAIEGDD